MSDRLINEMILQLYLEMLKNTRMEDASVFFELSQHSYVQQVLQDSIKDQEK